MNPEKETIKTEHYQAGSTSLSLEVKFSYKDIFIDDLEGLSDAELFIQYPEKYISFTVAYEVYNSEGELLEDYPIPEYFLNEMTLQHKVEFLDDHFNKHLDEEYFESEYTVEEFCNEYTDLVE